MRIVVFFIYLCSLLLGVNGDAHAGIHHNNISKAPVHGKEAQAAHFIKIVQAHTIVKDIDLDREEYLLCDDVEDEDINDLQAKKYRPQSLSCSTNLYQFSLLISGHDCNCPKAVPFLYSQASCKYIIQRSLRI